MLSKQARQTGMIVFMLTVCIQEQAKRSDWWVMAHIEDQDQLLYWRSRSTALRHQVIDLKEQLNQDQDTKVIWRLQKQEWGSTYDWLPWGATRVCVFFLFIFIDSCVNFAKYVELNHTHKEKVFYGKAWHIVSRSGIEISVPAAPTQKHGNYLVFEFPKPLWTLSNTRVYGIFNDLCVPDTLRVCKNNFLIMLKDFRKNIFKKSCFILLFLFELK